MDAIDRSVEERPATFLAVLTFLIFACLVAGIVTDTFALDDRVEAWVGTGLVGLGSALFTAWAVVLHYDVRLPGWLGRAGDDLLLVGLGVLVVVAGLPTFAAGVL